MSATSGSAVDRWTARVRWVRLGVRLSVGSGRSGALRTMLMASGAALGTLVVLAALAGSSTYGKQYDRDSARTPVESAEQVQTRPRVTELTFGGGYDSIDGRRLIRVAVGGATAASPLAPGLRAYPGPGEAVISPALAELIRTDERAKARFPQRVVGLIGPAGLVAPDELYAYVGVPADDPYLVTNPPVREFRNKPSPWTIGPTLRDAFTPERMAGVFFALFVLVPFGVFLGTCARLSASSRDRRIAALRLLGVSARQAALVNAVETGVVAGAGTLVGYAAFRSLAPLSQGWHVGRLRWFAADLTLPVPVIVLVLAATVTYAVAIGVVATRPARVAPLQVRRDAPARRPTPWRLALLAAGVGLVLVSVQSAGAASLLPYLAFVAALVLVGIGIPLTVPLFTWLLAGVLGRTRGAPVALHLAAARLRHAPSVAPRLVASLAAAVYVAGVGSLGATLLADTLDARDETAEVAAGARTYQTTVLEPALAAEVQRAGGTFAWEGWYDVLVGGAPASALLADCPTIRATYRLGPGETCVDGRTYRLVNGPGEPAVAAGTPVREAAGNWSGKVPAATLHLTPKLGYGADADILVTPASPMLGKKPEPVTGWVQVIVPDRQTGDRVAQVVSAMTPANDIQGHFADSGVDGGLLRTLLTVGLAISAGLGIAAFAVAAVDRTVERRRESAMLAAVGTPGRVIAASEVGFAALPLLVGLVLATGAVAGATLALARVIGVRTSAAVDVAGPALGFGAAALVVGLVLVTVPALVPRRITAETIRRT